MAKNSGGTRAVTQSKATQSRTLTSKAFSSFSPEVKNEIANYKGLSEGYKETISNDLKTFDTQYKRLKVQMDKLQSQHDDGDINDDLFNKSYSGLEKKMDKVMLNLRSKMAKSGIKRSALKIKGNVGFIPDNK